MPYDMDDDPPWAECPQCNELAHGRDEIEDIIRFSVSIEYIHDILRELEVDSSMGDTDTVTIEDKAYDKGDSLTEIFKYLHDEDLVSIFNDVVKEKSCRTKGRGNFAVDDK